MCSKISRREFFWRSSAAGAAAAVGAATASGEIHPPGWRGTAERTDRAQPLNAPQPAVEKSGTGFGFGHLYE